VLALSSEPPLPESDVLAVLVFGAPTQDLGQGQQAELQARAIGLATSYVAGGLTRSFRERLGLDLFDVSVGDRRNPGEVRIGRHVTDDVFVSVAPPNQRALVDVDDGRERRRRPLASPVLKQRSSGVHLLHGARVRTPRRWVRGAARRSVGDRHASCLAIAG
jgi:hypothetical protein